MSDAGSPLPDDQLPSEIDKLDLEQKKLVLEQLEKAKDIKPGDIFTQESFKGEIQQGDILLDMPIIDPIDLERLMGEGKEFADIPKGPVVVLSNACDIIRGQKRAIRIAYCPILKFESYRSALSRPGEDVSAVDSLLGNFKKQSVPKVAYLPPTQHVSYEGLLFLDYILSASLDFVFPGEASLEARWGGSMSLAGWHLLISKLMSFYYRPTYDQIQLRISAAT